MSELAKMLAGISEDAPYIVALVILVIGFLYYQYKFTEAVNARMERQETRHSGERQKQEDRWAERFGEMGAECHAGQDRATAAIEKLSETTQRSTEATVSLSSKLDTLISERRRG